MTEVAEILLPLNPVIWLIVGALLAVLLPLTLSRWFAVILPLFLIVLRSFFSNLELVSMMMGVFNDFQSVFNDFKAF